MFMNWINYWKTKVIIRYEFQKANFPMEFISCVRKLILLNILKQEAGELLISGQIHPLLKMLPGMVVKNINYA